MKESDDMVILIVYVEYCTFKHEYNVRMGTCSLRFASVLLTPRQSHILHVSLSRSLSTHLSSQALRFCKSKCFRNFKLRRNPRKTRWTKAFRKAHGKEMAVDSTFEFERRRNQPIKYDRELMAKTLVAMKRVDQIREAREARFRMIRRRGVKARQKEEALREIKQNIDLIISPLARRRQEELAQQQGINVAQDATSAMIAAAAAILPPPSAPKTVKLNGRTMPKMVPKERLPVPGMPKKGASAAQDDDDDDDDDNME